LTIFARLRGLLDADAPVDLLLQMPGIVSVFGTVTRSKGL